MSGDLIRILYSLPHAISPGDGVAYTASHIPSANAFCYRSLPSFPLATVRECSIRNRGPPPRSLLCGCRSWEVKRLRSGTLGCLLWFDLSVSVCSGNLLANLSSRLMIQMEPRAIVAPAQVWTSHVSCWCVHFYGLTNTNDFWKNPLPLPLSLGIFLFFCSFPRLTQPPPCTLFSIGTPPCINIVLL